MEWPDKLEHIHLVSLGPLRKKKKVFSAEMYIKTLSPKYPSFYIGGNCESMYSFPFKQFYKQKQKFNIK